MNHNTVKSINGICQTNGRRAPHVNAPADLSQTAQDCLAAFSAAIAEGRLSKWSPSELVGFHITEAGGSCFLAYREAREEWLGCLPVAIDSLFARCYREARESIIGGA